MRKGFNPQIHLNADGVMFALSTGADHCTEHERGSQAMMDALTDGTSFGPRDLAASLQRKHPLTRAKNLLRHVPELLPRKRIKHNLNKILFRERVIKGVPEAVVYYHPLGEGFNAFEEAPLDFSSFCGPQNAAGAWNNRSFAFRVSGHDEVERLRVFAQALRAGEGVFAGTFLQACDGRRPTGVIIAIEALLPQDALDQIAKAQAQFVSDVHLHLVAKTDALDEAFRKSKVGGYVWPVWRDEAAGEVAYAINPSRDQIPYYGPYAFEDLVRWAETDGAFVPERLHNKKALA